MKKFTHVPTWPPGSSANGIVTYAAQLVPALRQLGHEVYVLTSNHIADVADAYTIDLKKVQIRHPLWFRIDLEFLSSRRRLGGTNYRCGSEAKGTTQFGRA